MLYSRHVTGMINILFVLQFRSSCQHAVVSELFRGGGMNKKRIIWTIILLVIVFGAIFGFDILRSHIISERVKNFKMPPYSVNTASVKSETWQPSLSAIGTLTAQNGVDVTSEVSGMVVGIHFKSGDIVKKGQLLVQLDDDTDIQSYEYNKAGYQLKKIDYTRQLALYQKQAIAKSTLDTALAEQDQAKAMMNRSLVAINQKKITAPFSGRLGIREINLGQYVNPGATFVTLQALNPMMVDFTLPQNQLGHLTINQNVHVFLDAYPDITFPGKILAVSSLVSQSSRNVMVRATLPNDKNLLIPGSYVSVKVLLPIHNKVLTVPQTAINYSLYGNTVFRVNKGTKTVENGKTSYEVDQVFVTVGDLKGSVASITKGLKLGDWIVTSGQLKIHQGAWIYINNTISLK